MPTLRNRSTGAVLARRVRHARNPLQRVVGLLARDRMGSDEGLLFERCRAVHTVGMRVTVDLLFLDHWGRVIECRPEVRPGRPVVTCAGAAAVLEMGPGFLAGADILAGDLLHLDDEAELLGARRDRLGTAVR